MAKYITYTTEKRINAIKRECTQVATGTLFFPNFLREVAVHVWDNIFCAHHFDGGTLKDLETELGGRLNNYDLQIEINKEYFESKGIFGIEYKTNGNVRYVGTAELHYINIRDFNDFVKMAF